MFFNQDILFNNGPFALVWQAGNGDISTKDLKTRRNKNYQRIIHADIIQICDLVRKHLPEMGSPNGITLKKIATLMKGLGVVYLTKMEDLARDINECQIKIFTTATFRNKKNIDMGEPPKAQLNLVENRADFDQLDFVEFGEIELFEIGFQSHPGAPRALPSISDNYFGTPLRPDSPETENNENEGQTKNCRRRKSKNRLQEDDVMNMFQDITNPRAHCLPEDDGIPVAPPQQDFGDGFGFDGFGDIDMFNPHVTTGGNEFQAPECTTTFDDNRDRLSSPPGRKNTTADADGGDGRTGRRSSRRAQEDEEDFLTEREGNVPLPQESSQSQDSNNSLLILGPLSRPNSAGSRGSRRRKMKLQIDYETQISCDEMRAQVASQKRPLDYDELTQIMRGRMANPKRAKINQTVMDLISGNRIERIGLGNDLTIFIRNHIIDLRKRPLRAVVEPLRAEGPGPSNRVEQSNWNIEPSGVDMNNATAPPPQLGDQDGSQRGRQDFNVDEQESEFPGFPNDNAADNLPVEDFQPPQLSPRVNDIIDEVETRVDHIHSRVIEAQQTTFREMFKPATTSRKKAALGFSQLLRLHAKEKVRLDQNEAFGEILISKI